MLHVCKRESLLRLLLYLQMPARRASTTSQEALLVLAVCYWKLRGHQMALANPACLTKPEFWPHAALSLSMR